MPAVAAVLVLAVLIDTLRSAASLSAGQWVGATAGILVGGFIAYLMASRSRVVFDAERREVRWHHSGWPGQGQGACPLDDLTAVRLLGDESEGGAQGLALLTLHDSVSLTRHNLAVQRSHKETAVSIREWLSRHGYDVPAA